MIERDILLLVDRDSGIDLSRLQQDLWTREALVRGNMAATRRLVSWQVVVIAFAVVLSASVGSSLAISGAKAQSHRALVDAEALAPSSLLFGVHL